VSIIVIHGTYLPVGVVQGPVRVQQVQLEHPRALCHVSCVILIGVFSVDMYVWCIWCIIVSIIVCVYTCYRHFGQQVQLEDPRALHTHTEMQTGRIYVCMYVYMYVCMYICMYVCMYI
jgi:hypothetical protein